MHLDKRREFKKWVQYDYEKGWNEILGNVIMNSESMSDLWSFFPLYASFHFSFYKHALLNNKKTFLRKIWGLLGEHGNWMGLRDSLFSWGSIWRSSPASLKASSLVTSKLVGPVLGPFSPWPLHWELASLSPPTLASPASTGTNYDFLQVPSVQVTLTHLTTPQAPNHAFGGTPAESRPSLLTFRSVDSVLKGGGLWPSLFLNAGTTF